jgi:hypothetical protein
MVVIKVNFGGDLRRITLDENIPLNIATEKLKKLYNLHLTNFGVDILWVSEDGAQKELINSDKKFQEFISKSLTTSNKILRLELQRKKCLISGFLFHRMSKLCYRGKGYFGTS